jgi:hypothetical protein
VHPLPWINSWPFYALGTIVSNFAASSAEVFQILLSFDYTVMLYGEDGNRVEDPEEARRMFARPENLMVALHDDGDDSCVRLYIGKETRIVDIFGLVTSLRTAASKYNLLFNVSQYNKEIEPKDFAGEAKVEESIAVREQSERIADRIMRQVRLR